MTAGPTRTATPGSCASRGGKVVDGTAFYDSISFNDLWERVRAPEPVVRQGPGGARGRCRLGASRAAVRS